MLLTEKHAAATWCPHAEGRAWEHVGRTTPPGSLGPEWRSCIGAKCMAWRWKADPDARGALATQVQMYVPTGEKWECEHCKGEGCAECDGEGRGTMMAPVGYCGLAGALEVHR